MSRLTPIFERFARIPTQRDFRTETFTLRFRLHIEARRPPACPSHWGTIKSIFSPLDTYLVLSGSLIQLFHLGASGKPENAIPFQAQHFKLDNSYRTRALLRKSRYNIHQSCFIFVLENCFSVKTFHVLSSKNRSKAHWSFPPRILARRMALHVQHMRSRERSFSIIITSNILLEN